MLSSIFILFLLWSTGTILLILYTVDDESPRAKKVTAADLAPGVGSGLGGELSRLEATYVDAELELHRAHYLADHKHGYSGAKGARKTTERVDGVLRWRTD